MQKINRFVRTVKLRIIFLVYSNFVSPFVNAEASDSVGDKEWYFFCRRGQKYKNSIRPNRVTKSGFWKATGIDKPVYSVGDFHNCIGLKKSLVYYRGSAGKGTKTDWMMHEFRLSANSSNDTSDIKTSTQEAVRLIHLK